MIEEIKIQNFKSIQDLTMKLSRVTVLIGENGCGKSNLLEAIAFAAAAAANNTLDNDILVRRGIRLTEPQFMRTAFGGVIQDQIHIGMHETGQIDLEIECIATGDTPYTRWMTVEEEGYYKTKDPSERSRLVSKLADKQFRAESWSGFMIFSPENSALRTFESEAQVQPLGTKGEGLFKLLKVLSSEEGHPRLDEIRDNLRLIDWFADLRIAPDQAPFERTLQIKDRYLSDKLAYFDQRSSNEGFLFLVFYFALFIAKQTPAFFAIDNIDASLNPKLCTELMARIVSLAKKHDKQVVITTHNPAVLDGLDLQDEDQRLLVVYRDSQGRTKLRRVTPPQPIAGEPPVRLSEAFQRGLLGGLPLNF